MQNNTMLVASETTVAGQIDHKAVVQDDEQNTDLDSSVDDMSSANTKRLCSGISGSIFAGVAGRRRLRRLHHGVPRCGATA